MLYPHGVGKMRIKSYRYTSQIIFFFLAIFGIFGVGMSGLIYPFFFCYGCPFAVASCPIGLLEHFAIDLQLNFIEALKLGAYLFGFIFIIGVIFGRAFCGWACPIGTLQDIINAGRKYTLEPILKKLKIQRFAHKLKYLKYIILILIPITSFLFLDLIYTRFCPVGGLTATFPTLFFYSEYWEPTKDFLIKIVSVILFFIVIILAGRGWCKFLCPIGALMAPFNKISALNVNWDEKKCTDCKKCIKVCPMDVDLLNGKRDLECILCGKCVDACRFDALHFQFLGRGKK
jgi:polyferredoxin